MNNFKKFRKSGAVNKAQQGSVLIEALISVLIFSMGILALIGLQGAMIKNTSDSKYRADAMYVAQSEIGKMWVLPFAKLVANAKETDISGVLPNGKKIVTFDAATGSITVEVQWQAPGSDPHKYKTQAFIRN